MWRLGIHFALPDVFRPSTAAAGSLEHIAPNGWESSAPLLHSMEWGYLVLVRTGSLGPADARPHAKGGGRLCDAGASVRGKLNLQSRRWSGFGERSNGQLRALPRHACTRAFSGACYSSSSRAFRASNSSSEIAPADLSAASSFNCPMTSTAPPRRGLASLT